PARTADEAAPVAHAAGDDADLLLLVRAAEVERGHVGPPVHLPGADLQPVLAPGDLLVDRPLGVERLARLVDVGHVHRRTHPDGPAVGLLGPGQHAEQRGLAGAVRADDADDAGP